MVEYINYEDIPKLQLKYNVSYIRKGWDTISQFKAVLHSSKGNIKGYFRLMDLKDANPYYKTLKEIQTIDNYGEPFVKIYISEKDFDRFKMFKKEYPVNGYDNSYTGQVNELGLKERFDGGYE